ncbi:hypothetical protein RZS08_42040, partial [Arthrospira platensis SPKY1]|nr:hypothetical protein [Arthrospira platensis SPKY1]
QGQDVFGDIHAGHRSAAGGIGDGDAAGAGRQGAGVRSALPVVPGEGIRRGAARSAGAGLPVGIARAGRGRGDRFSGQLGGLGDGDGGGLLLAAGVGDGELVLPGGEALRLRAAEPGLAPLIIEGRFAAGDLGGEGRAAAALAGDLGGLVQPQGQGQDVFGDIHAGHRSAAGGIGDGDAAGAGRQGAGVRSALPVVPGEGIRRGAARSAGAGLPVGLPGAGGGGGDGLGGQLGGLG